MGMKRVVKVPLSWKKSISQGIVIPQKMKICGDCKVDILCDNCDNLVKQTKRIFCKSK